MPIPAELNYANEDEFVQAFLIPLLQRVGFSLVVNYHGHAELGKDLIFAEIDRLGHVRYHGLQAKYESSISLNQIESLITDCKQAFANPFTHPQTGEVERVSSFYAVNAGSIGPAAVQHYFNSLMPVYGGNARLLQAKDLLTLDRWASVNQTGNVVATVNGLRIELVFNDRIAIIQLSCLQRRIAGEDVPWPLARFKIDAVSAYLQQPILQNFVKTDHALKYWELCRVCNSVFDMLSPGVAVPKNATEVMLSCLDHLSDIDALSKSMQLGIQQSLQVLGPLAAI
ncbi:MAG: hypothetical protein IT363_13785 [Methanoregulaceae archaeon]|nr:hypothetical protein [Methanoregulaceae archaeon]